MNSVRISYLFIFLFLASVISPMLKLYISIDIEFAELLDKTEEENNEKESIQDFDFNSPVLKPETLQISLLKKKRKFGFYKSEYQNNIIKIIPPPPERTC